MRLHERLTAIEDAVYDMVDEIDYTIIDESLSDVSIHKGKKGKGQKIKPPLIAVYFENADIDHAGASIHSEWAYNLYIIGMIVGKDVDKMREISTEMTALTMDEIIKDRSLKQTVRDIVEVGFIPGDERFEIGTNVFASLAELQARFRYRPNY